MDIKGPVEIRRVLGIDVEAWPSGDIVIRARGPITLTPKMARTFVREIQEMVAESVLRGTDGSTRVRG